jgi:hypothetical protein
VLAVEITKVEVERLDVRLVEVAKLNTFAVAVEVMLKVELPAVKVLTLVLLETNNPQV